MSTEPKKLVHIIMQWSQAVIDPVQYKPLSPTLQPQNVFIGVDIPDNPDYIVSINETGVQLTPTGLAYACRQIATAIQKSYSEGK